MPACRLRGKGRRPVLHLRQPGRRPCRRRQIEQQPMNIKSRWTLASLLFFAHALRAAPGADAPILMPPFLVEEQKGDGIEWIYGSGGDIRVLSGCGTDQTA